MKEHWFYYLTKFSTWIGLKLFFSKIEVLGADKIPKNSAIIFTPNHQGAFMDAFAVGVFIRWAVSFLTRSDVFNRWSKPILYALNMIAIYRIRDGIKNLSQNEAVFETCFRLLSEKQTILIFPEGNHNIEYYLRPLSKGTARLALDARNQIKENIDVYIVPTGINYFSHYRPASRLTVKYGDPINLQDYMELYQEHSQKAYNKLKADLAEAMKATLILAEETDDYEIRRDWIFQPKHEKLSFDKLKEMAEKGTPEPRKSTAPGFFKRLLIGFFGIFNYPPLLGTKKMLGIVKDVVFTLSIKYLAGSFFHIIWWSFLFALGTIWIGLEAGLVFAAAAIFSAFARQTLIRY